MRITHLAKKFRNAISFQPLNNAQISSEQRSKQDERKIKFVLVSATLGVLVVEPSIAFATDNLSTAASNILGLFTGTLGKAVATIAVVVMGLMAMFGRLEWERAFKVILGIAIVFGAAKFVTLISGSNEIGQIGTSTSSTSSSSTTTTP